MCDCTFDSFVGKGEFSLVLETLHVCGHVHVRSHVSQGIDYVQVFHKKAVILPEFQFLLKFFLTFSEINCLEWFKLSLLLLYVWI